MPLDIKHHDYGEELASSLASDYIERHIDLLGETEALAWVELEGELRIWEVVHSVHESIPNVMIGWKHEWEEPAERAMRAVVDIAKPLEIAQINSRFDFPDYLKQFVEERDLPVDTLSRIAVVIEKMNEFLSKKGVAHKITPDLFADPEFTNWKQIELSIRTRESFKKVSDELKPQIYEIVAKNLPDYLLEKVLITFEPL